MPSSAPPPPSGIFLDNLVMLPDANGDASLTLRNGGVAAPELFSFRAPAASPDVLTLATPSNLALSAADQLTELSLGATGVHVSTHGSSGVTLQTTDDGSEVGINATGEACQINLTVEQGDLNLTSKHFSSYVGSSYSHSVNGVTGDSVLTSAGTLQLDARFANANYDLATSSNLTFDKSLTYLSATRLLRPPPSVAQLAQPLLFRYGSPNKATSVKTDDQGNLYVIDNSTGAETRQLIKYAKDGERQLFSLSAPFANPRFDVVSSAFGTRIVAHGKYTSQVANPVLNADGTDSGLVLPATQTTSVLEAYAVIAYDTSGNALWANKIQCLIPGSLDPPDMWLGDDMNDTDSKRYERNMVLRDDGVLALVLCGARNISNGSTFYVNGNPPTHSTVMTINSSGWLPYVFTFDADGTYLRVFEISLGTGTYYASPSCATIDAQGNLVIASIAYTLPGTIVLKNSDGTVFTPATPFTPIYDSLSFVVTWNPVTGNYVRAFSWAMPEIWDAWTDAQGATYVQGAQWETYGVNNLDGTASGAQSQDDYNFLAKFDSAGHLVWLINFPLIQTMPSAPVGDVIYAVLGSTGSWVTATSATLGNLTLPHTSTAGTHKYALAKISASTGAVQSFEYLPVETVFTTQPMYARDTSTLIAPFEMNALGTYEFKHVDVPEIAATVKITSKTLALSFEGPKPVALSSYALPSSETAPLDGQVKTLINPLGQSTTVSLGNAPWPVAPASSLTLRYASSTEEWVPVQELASTERILDGAVTTPKIARGATLRDGCLQGDTSVRGDVLPKGEVNVGSVATGRLNVKAKSVAVNGLVTCKRLQFEPDAMVYPPVSATPSEPRLVVSDQDYGNGTYVFSASGEETYYNTSKATWVDAFVSPVGSGFFPESGYSPYTGYNNGITTTMTDAGSISGEWLQVDCPESFMLTECELLGNGSMTWHPSQWTVAGSTDGTSWTVLYRTTEPLPQQPATFEHTFVVGSTIAYSKYRLIIERGYTNWQQRLNVGGWRLYHTSPQFSSFAVGKSVAETPLDVVGTTQLDGDLRIKQDNQWDLGAPDFRFRNAYFWRVITTAGTGTTSDARAKRDFAPIQGALDKVDALSAYTYSLCNEPDPGRRHAGLLAQDVLRVLPEAVDAPSDPAQMMSLHYDGVVSLLVEAVKELRAEVRRLQQH